VSRVPGAATITRLASATRPVVVVTVTPRSCWRISFTGSLTRTAPGPRRSTRPRAAPAQPARKVYRIGILALPETSDMVGPQPRSPVHNALLRGLRELGYVYGEHFVTEPRGAAGKPERFPGLAAELVRLKVDVIVAAGPALSALKQARSTIPIVMNFIRVMASMKRGFTPSSQVLMHLPEPVQVSAQRAPLLRALRRSASTPSPCCSGRPWSTECSQRR
jgi:hypothetical protein